MWRIQTTNQRAAAVVAIHGAADGGSTSGTSHGLARALWEWRGAPRRGGREGQKSNASAGGRRRKEEEEDIRGSPTRDPPDPRPALCAQCGYMHAMICDLACRSGSSAGFDNARRSCHGRRAPWAPQRPNASICKTTETSAADGHAITFPHQAQRHWHRRSLARSPHVPSACMQARDWMHASARLEPDRSLALPPSATCRSRRPRRARAPFVSLPWLPRPAAALPPPAAARASMHAVRRRGSPTAGRVARRIDDRGFDDRGGRSAEGAKGARARRWSRFARTRSLDLDGSAWRGLGLGPTPQPPNARPPSLAALRLYRHDVEAHTRCSAAATRYPRTPQQSGICATACPATAKQVPTLGEVHHTVLIDIKL